MFYQQGDVIVRKVLKAEGNKLNHLTLAKGEATGHHHTITKGDAALYEQDGKLFLHVESENAILTHQEHDTVIIPRGDYEIGRVQEYDHFAEEAKDIKD